MIRPQPILSTEAPSPDGAGDARTTPPAYLAPAYLTSWAAHGTLCAMRKVDSAIVVAQAAPDAADFVPQPGNDDDLAPELILEIEQHLATLKQADPAAALRPMLHDRLTDLDAAGRENFARFVTALLLRNASVVAKVAGAMRDILDTGTRELRARYAARRSDPKTFAEYVTRANPEAPNLAASQYLRKVMDGEAIAAAINKMQWARIPVAKARFTLLTSDAPLDMPLSLADKNAYLALPLSPSALFVASNNKSLLDTLSRQDPSKVVRLANASSVTRARGCVFSVDDRQLAFVKHHFGETPATPSLADGPRQEALAGLRRGVGR